MNCCSVLWDEELYSYIGGYYDSISYYAQTGWENMWKKHGRGPTPNVFSSAFLVLNLMRLNTNVWKAIVVTFSLGCHRNQRFLTSRNQNPLRILLAFKQSQIKLQIFLLTARKSKRKRSWNKHTKSMEHLNM